MHEPHLLKRSTLPPLSALMNEYDMPQINYNAANKLKLLMKLRSAGIRDTAVLAAMEAIPREQFIMPAFLEKSYEDTALPIASGQTISQPTIVAAMTEALELNDRSRVLEVGTGSGYQTAILAKLARMVYSIERFENLSKEAEVLLSDMNLRNVNIRCADGFSGWPEAAPFERIIVTAAADEIPAVLLGQLSNENGIMIIPVGEDPSKQVLLKVRKTPHDLNITELMNVRFVPMIEGVVAQ